MVTAAHNRQAAMTNLNPRGETAPAASQAAASRLMVPWKYPITTQAMITSANFTSIYAVNFGTDHFFGWQFSDLNVEDMGLINNGVIYRTLLDWAVGFMNTSTRSIGRLYDIKIG